MNFLFAKEKDGPKVLVASGSIPARSMLRPLENAAVVVFPRSFQAFTVAEDASGQRW